MVKFRVSAFIILLSCELKTNIFFRFFYIETIIILWIEINDYAKFVIILYETYILLRMILTLLFFSLLILNEDKIIVSFKNTRMISSVILETNYFFLLII